MIDILKSDSTINVKLPIMGQERYIKAKSDNYGWFQSESCILPFILDKRFIFTRMVFMSEIVARKEKLSLEDEKNFLNEVVDYIGKQKLCDFIYKAQSNVIFNVCPKSAVCVPWGTHIVDIDKSEEDLLMSFKSKSRQKIRKAIKTGVTIEKTEDINLIYEHIKETLERQKSIHYPSLEYLKSLQKNLGENSKFFVAIQDGKIQGCVNIVYDGEKGFAIYAGSHPKPTYGALNLMYYEIMKYLQQRGVKTFDFVGTKINIKPDSKFSGISQFKNSFKPVIHEGYAFKVVVNPFKYFLFNIMSKIYLGIKGYQYSDPIDNIKREHENE